MLDLIVLMAYNDPPVRMPWAAELVTVDTEGLAVLELVGMAGECGAIKGVGTVARAALASAVDTGEEERDEGTGVVR